MRIVGGRLKGRSLAPPKSDSIRPTSDRVRESVFNILEHAPDLPEIEGSNVIDLFAGTGALGLEAASRGAAYVLFVEQSAEARGLLRTNIEALALVGQTRIFRRDATRLGPIGRGHTYDIAFLDPPYSKGLAERALTSLADGGWLSDGAAVVVEEHANYPLELHAPYQELDRRTYGDTQVIIARYSRTGDSA